MPNTTKEQAKNLENVVDQGTGTNIWGKDFNWYVVDTDKHISSDDCILNINPLRKLFEEFYSKRLSISATPEKFSDYVKTAGGIADPEKHYYKWFEYNMLNRFINHTLQELRDQGIQNPNQDDFVNKAVEDFKDSWLYFKSVYIESPIDDQGTDEVAYLNQLANKPSFLPFYLMVHNKDGQDLGPHFTLERFRVNGYTSDRLIEAPLEEIKQVAQKAFEKLIDLIKTEKAYQGKIYQQKF